MTMPWNMGLSKICGSFRRVPLFKECGLWSAYSQAGGAQPRPGGRAGPCPSPGPTLPHGGHLPGAGSPRGALWVPHASDLQLFPFASVTEKLRLWSVTAQCEEAVGRGPGLRPGFGCRPAVAQGSALRRCLCALPVAAVTNHHQLRA